MHSKEHTSNSPTYERINRAFLESQKIWQAYDGDVDGMVKQCEEETGVTVEFREGSMDQW